MENLIELKQTPLLWWLEALIIVIGITSAIHAMLRKREPRAALLWMVICIFIPFLGPVLYLLLGINRIHRADKLGEVKLSVLPSYLQQNAPHHEDMLYPKHVLLGATVTGKPLCPGNQVAVLSNGEESYPAMLEAIHQARIRIYLAMYIFEHKGVGKQFIDALTEAVARGVDVRVLLDGVGAWYSFGMTYGKLKKKGVKVVYFLPPRLIPPQLGINLRNHRKILIVDNTTSFVGGMNIRPVHIIKANSLKNAVRDTMYRIEGPVLEQMCQIFSDDWLYTSGENLPKYPHDTKPAGSSWCRVIADGPGLQLDTLINILLGAINSALKSIEIKTPYFLPPREIISALQSAALRGVEVTVILPSHNNLPYMHWASRHMLWQLLKYGVRVFYQPEPFDHSKLLVIDQHYSQIGSANLDSRSLRLNFELMIEIYDSDLGKKLSSQFVHDRDLASEATQEQLDDRHLIIKLRDAFFWLFTPYL